MQDEGPQDLSRLDENFASAPVEDGLRWIDIRQFGLEGRGWTDTAHPYDRLPARAEGLVPDPVWQLGRQSAGLRVRLVTDATTIAARWRVCSEPLGAPHMAATCVSGLDLYVRDGGGWHWLATGQPMEFPDNQVTLAPDLLPGKRELMLYLPLYNGVESAAVGVPPEAFVGRAPEPQGGNARPICFYGTSIVQGGCASRPGMAYPAILGRRLDRPFLNLGFSGNGRMEPAMADLLAELDPSVYVLDCLPNLQPDEVTERVEPFVLTLRAGRPETPIVLVESMPYQDAAYRRERHKRYTAANAALREALDRLRADGIEHLHYVQGDGLLGTDGEATVDGTHFTDLGFMRMADALEGVLRPLV